MKKNNLAWLIFSLILGVAVTSEAVTAVQAGKSSLEISYVEPTTSADGSPLDDLQYTTVQLSVDGVDQGSVNIPATALTGGGVITHSFDVDQKPNTMAQVVVTVTASDEVPNVSEPLVYQTVVDWLPPGQVK